MNNSYKLLKFSSGWCLPCKQLQKVIDGITLPYPIEYHDIDNEDSMQLAANMNVRNVPTMILLDNEGNVLKVKAGAMSEKQLMDFLEV